jgi:methionyl-tRNA formyltransferase
MHNYLVATVKPWNINAFHEYTKDLPGKWHLINHRDELCVDFLNELNPRYIFFPHWSWLVPSEIVNNFECVCFHMADVPHGRGGSPLQNLIVRGHKSTKLSALRMVAELDAGPVYGKTELSLTGCAQDIFIRTSVLVYDLISMIVDQEPSPSPQEGEVVVFKRRKPEQSLLPTNVELSQLYDHVRMLDALSYPHAYIEYGDFRLEFTDANMEDGNLVCKVLIKKDKNAVD